MFILKNFLKDIAGIFVFLRFKNIWRLKKHINEKNKQSGLCASIYSKYFDDRDSYIGINAKFGTIPYFPHGVHGIFISDKTVIGKNAVIFQQVTIGAIRTEGSKNVGNPTIGDNCYIGAGAKILGNIKIGDNCRIGANAVVTKDMPDNTVAYASETVFKTKKEKMDNRFYVLRPNGDIEYYDNGVFKKKDN